jgi:arsenate reductase
MPRILFVDDDHACRAPMARVFARLVAPPDVEAVSAGRRPGPPHPLARRVLAELGLEMPEEPGRALAEMAGESFDLTVILSTHLRQREPVLHGLHGVLWWDLADPLATEGPDEARLSALRRCREEIRDRVRSQALAGPAGGHLRAGRKRKNGSGARAGHKRHQPRPEGNGSAGRVP